MSDNDHRSQLALKMINTLPQWGFWAASMREVDTPYGRIGYRQASMMWLMRHGQSSGQQCTTTTLASQIGVQNSVITRAGEHLESLGLIKRTVSADDRRRQFLTLTKNGVKASEYIENLYVESISDAMQDIDDDSLTELKAAVDTLDALSLKLIAKSMGKRR